MNILINYANDRFSQVQKIQSWTGKHIAHFDRIYAFGPNDIDPIFYKKHINIFNYKRGNGLWLWKLYLINKVMEECHDGDNLFYVDSGAFFIRSPKILYTYLSDVNPIFVTDIPLIESCWTKPSCIERMGGAAFLYSNQIQATFILIRINNYTRSFIKEYLALCAESDLLIPEGLGKYDAPQYDYKTSFVAHREDQSVLSLLCKKHGIHPHRDISQRGKNPMSYYNPNYAYLEPLHPNDTYQTILFLHKSPSLGFKFWLRYIINKFKNKSKPWKLNK